MRITVLLSVLILVSCQSRVGAERDDLTWAVRNGKVAEVRMLLAQGEDANRPVGVNSWPPLMHAVHKNQIGTAAALLEHGADINRGGPDGMTPLMMAAGYGNDDMVAFLLAHHADAHVKTKDGASALDFALTGVSDIDQFTLFRCQDSTVALLLRDHPDLRATTESSSRTFARIKGCAS
jgi:ankyrin repeat protein